MADDWWSSSHSGGGAAGSSPNNVDASAGGSSCRTVPRTAAVQLLIIARRRDEVFVLLHADDTGAAAIESRQLEAGDEPREVAAQALAAGTNYQLDEAARAALTATPATQNGDCCFCVILHVEELPAIPRATSAGAAEIADVWGISAGDGHHSWVHLLHTESLELATSCQKPLEYMRGLLRSERALSVEKWVTALAEELGVSGWPFDRAKLAQRQGAGSFEHGQEWMRWRRPGVAELPEFFHGTTLAAAKAAIADHVLPGPNQLASGKAWDGAFASNCWMLALAYTGPSAIQGSETRARIMLIVASPPGEHYFATRNPRYKIAKRWIVQAVLAQECIAGGLRATQTYKAHRFSWTVDEM